METKIGLYSPSSKPQAIDVTFDNSGSNLASTNTENAIKEVNSKIKDFSTTIEIFIANQNKTLTHNLGTKKILVLFKKNGTDDSYNSAYGTNTTNTTVEVQLAIAGSYDFLYKKLDTE